MNIHKEQTNIISIIILFIVHLVVNICIAEEDREMTSRRKGQSVITTQMVRYTGGALLL